MTERLAKVDDLRASIKTKAASDKSSGSYPVRLLEAGILASDNIKILEWFYSDMIEEKIELEWS